MGGEWASVSLPYVGVPIFIVTDGFPDLEVDSESPNGLKSRLADCFEK